MIKKSETDCPECGSGISRRSLLLGAGAAVGAIPLAAAVQGVSAAPPAAQPASGAARGLVSALHATLSPAQRSAVCFDWNHPKRNMIANNWQIVPQTIKAFYTPEQREMIFEVFKAAHSPEWVERRLKQLQDDGGGWQNYQIAIFGAPDSGPYEWVMTGRHLTLRVDDDSNPGTAFGGPIFYGHAAQGFNEKPDHPGNVYWHQALRANEVFKALDGKQRTSALVQGGVPPESPRAILNRPADQRPGIPVSTMTRDQRELVSLVLQDLLAPMRPEARAEARRYLDQHGGLESLSMAFYQSEDVGSDGVWDVWRLEGPSTVWYFRGAPHVHTWVYLHDGSERPAPIGPNGQT